MRELKAPPAWRRQRRAINQSASKFFLLLAIGLIISTCLYFELLTPQNGQQALLLSRDNDRNEDTCRSVHLAKDQCKFIKKHCPLDEAGFSEYLDLYFCQLSHVKPIAFVILAAWLGLLFSTIGIAASDFFCVDLSTMAKILGMSESMAGVTLLAFGNGSPDVFSTFAAMSTDTGDLAVGELMGAAGFITAVVAGSMAIIRPFKVSKKSFVRDVCFFALAAAFTMLILSDGLLHLWECLAMIGYYVFYVAFVLIWHWIEGRRKRKHDIETAARGHYTPAMDGQEHQQYSDEPDMGNLRPPTLRAPSHDDFAALDRSSIEEDEDYSDEERDRWMSELNRNMRLARPITRPRSTTIAPVRPSLVGALEFQAVLKSLQRSRNMPSVPLHPRRYSDDPNLRAYDADVHQDMHRRASINHNSPSHQRPHLHVSIPQGNSAVIPAYNPVETVRKPVNADVQRQSAALPPHTAHVAFQIAPTIEVSTSSPQEGPAGDFILDASVSRMPPQSSKSEDLFLHRRLLKNINSPNLSPRGSPRGQNVLLPSPPRSRSSTRTAKSTVQPFPPYRDEPAEDPMSPLEHLALPSPVVSTTPETLQLVQEEDDTDAPRSEQWKYWPYKFLPTPESLVCVLFPTIVGWQEKGIWAKSLGVIAAPSVFLLTITLPVVESDNAAQDVTSELAAPHDYKAVVNDEQSTSPDTPTLKHNMLEEGATGMGTSASVAVATEQQSTVVHRPTSQRTVSERQDNVMASMQQSALFEDWPRWLMLLQLYTAPLTIVLAVYIQSPESLPYSWLVRPCLVCLLISTLLLIPVLLTTTPSYRPKQYRWILSLAGFAVSIAWISTIASQVVGTLKALAIILNWSNAIMGLTVFAVGNSVSDLVADVTVANLGYPVMALSACFGGPMLNILLGIGLSGTYTILNGADKRRHKHPEKGYKIKSYHLDVGRTLIVSGVALLVTLVGVLILVPLNRWMMTRKIGVVLIVIWILSTIGNVVIEVTGIADISKTQ